MLDGGGLKRLLAGLRRWRHTALLLAIIGAFAVRPLIGAGQAAILGFNVAVIVLMLVALYAIHIDEIADADQTRRRGRRWRSVIGVLLALVAIAERVLTFLTPGPGLYTVATVTWLLFFTFVIWSELRSVLRQREVTGETISMSISIYLLLALCWGLLYFLIQQHQPGAFHLADPPPSGTPDGHLLPVFIYFSLTTISTIGFGDITPLTMQARYAAVAEGIAGQFYLAILVARLVGIQMSQSATARR